MATKKAEMVKHAREHMRGIENETHPSFTPDLSQLDEEGIRWDVQQAIRHGFTCTFAVTEAALTFEESKRFVEIVVDEAKEDILVSAPVTFDSMEKKCRLSQAPSKDRSPHLPSGLPPELLP